MNLLRIILVTSAILFLTLGKSFAGDIPFHSRISYGYYGNVVVEIGNTEASGSIGITSGVGTYSDLNIRNYLSLGIDHEIIEDSQEPFDIEVDVEVSPFIGGTPQAVFTKTLSIAYRPKNGEAYRDRDVYKFLNMESFDYEITAIRITQDSVTTSVTELPKNIFLDGDIIVNRVGDFTTESTDSVTLIAPTLLDLDCDSSMTAEEIRIQWNTIGTAVEYQLEWTFVNNYDGSKSGSTFGVLPADSLQFNFKTNSTRITTTNTYYDIPLVFESGYVIWRVRAVGYNPLYLNQPIFGVWSEQNTGALSDFIAGNTNGYVLNVNPHEVNKNWQLTTTFAEEGKKKEVVSYYDGSLRNRQSVTVVNTDNNVIVGETIYDQQGRPVINVLPVPVVRPNCSPANADTSKASIKFYPNFNRNIDSLEYLTRKQFDVDVSDCGTNLTPMSDSSGASQYYSELNPNKVAHQAYVPDANGYPFTQVEYTPDNTGRIRRQSGVGEDFQLGSGHESKYYYGKPFQLKLDRLFASQVGYASHYKKNLVIDPNGQISVSYLDQEGRVIASALAGEAPDNLNEIQSLQQLNNAGGVDLVVDLFEKNSNGVSTNNILNVNEDAIVFSQEVLVSTPGDYEFSYDLTKDAYSDTCTPSLCYNCVYDLTLTLVDECGAVVNDVNTGNPIEYIIQEGYFIKDTTGNFSTFTTNCDNGGVYQSPIYEFTANLAVGNYTVTKKLTLNNSVVSNAFQAYLLEGQSSGCIDSLGTFKAAEEALMDLSGCDISCDECVTNLGTLDDFVSNGLGTVNDYEALLEECQKPCTQPTFCETVLELLKADVSPGGQYGEYQVNGVTNISAFPLSVYNASNVLPFNSFNTPNQNWRNPSVSINGTTYNYYLDANGDSAKVYLTVIGSTVTPAVVNINTDVFVDASTGLSYTYPTLLQNVEDFINEFEYSWAQSLVVYHPEYSYYETCLSYEEEDVNGNSSESFDVLLRTTNSFQEAINRDLLVLNGSDYEAGDYASTSSNEYDPFITSGTYGANGTTLSNLKDLYITIGGADFSMQDFAAISARAGNGALSGDTTTLRNYANLFGDFSGSPTAVNDNEWSIFKSLYLGKKRELQNNYEDDQALSGSNNTLNDCIGDANFNPYTSGMWQSFSWPSFHNNPYYNGANACSIFKKGLYLNKTKRFPDNDDLEELGTDNNAGYQTFLQTGQCPKVGYLQNLLKELADDNKLTISLISLMGFPSYGVLYNNPSNPTPLTTKYWQVNSTVGGILNAVITDQSSYSCELNLYSSGQITDWNTVTSFSGIKFTGINGSGLYEFEIVASLMDSTHVTITGETCIDLANCVFENVCNANDLAISVKDVYTLLASEDNFVTASYTLPDSSSSPYSIAVKSQLLSQVNATTAGDISWSFNPVSSDTGKFTNGTNQYYIVFKSSTPTGFTNYDSIAYFNNIKSNYEYFFTVDAYNSSGVYLATLSCEAFNKQIGDSTLNPVSMGSCELPTPLACSQDEHQILKDLESLLKDVLVSTNYNIYQSSNITSLLESYLASDTSVGTIITADGEFGFPVDTTLLIDIYNSDDSSTCQIAIHFQDYDAENSFSSLVEIINVTATGTPVNNNYYDFNIEAVLMINPVHNITDTVILNGTSCLPILNCELCDSNISEGYISDSTLVANGGAYFLVLTGVNNDSCHQLYDDYVLAYNTYWDSTTIPYPEYTQPYYPLLSYSQFENRNLCCSSVGLVLFNDYLLTLNDYDAYPSVVPRRYVCNDDTTDLGDCETSYRLYLDRLLLHNDSNANQIDKLSFELFSILGYCDSIDCIENYINEDSLVDIREYELCDFVMELTTDCDEEYVSYISEITSYNNYLQQHNLDWPLITVKASESEFTNEKLCNCVDGYVAFLNTRINGTITTAPTTQELNILTYCPQAPCLPDSVFNTDTVTPITIDYVNPCEEQALNIAHLNAEIAYQEYVNNLATNFTQNMKEHCLDVEENFTLSFNDKEYHYTLYYYDQAGNLEQTVPPEGVEMIDIDSSSDALSLAIIQDRLANTQTVFTYHRLATKYKYNSLNQLTHQSLPDHDQMDVFEFSQPNGLDNKLTVQSIQFVTETKGYLSGYVTYSGKERGVLYTTNDGGLTWQKVNYTLGANLKAAAWISNDSAYAVGEKGILIYTSNGGYTWDMLNTYQLNISANLNDITYDATKGLYAVGDNGTILRVNGTNLTIVSPAYDPGQDITSNDNITSIKFLNGDAVLTVNRTTAGNYHGTIYVIDNINTTPNAEFYDEIRLTNLNDIQALNDTVFVAVANNGQFVKTVDGGDNWYVQRVASKMDFKAIYFSNVNEGLAVRENGELQATYNGGETWGTLDNTKTYSGLKGGSSSQAIAYGDNGVLTRVVLNTGGAYGLIPLITNTTSNIVAAWVGGSSPSVIYTTGNNEVVYTANAGVSSPNWTTYTNSFGTGIEDIEANINGSTLWGVLETDNKLYGFTISSGTYSQAGLLVSNIKKTNNAGEIIAFESTTGKVKSVNWDSFSGFLSGVTTNPVGDIGDVTALDKIGSSYLLAYPDGKILLGNSSIKDTQTYNIRPLPLTDFDTINSSLGYLTGENGTLINPFDNNKIIGTEDVEDYNALSSASGTNISILVGDNGLAQKFHNSTTPTTIITNITSDILDVALSPISNNAYYGTSSGTLYQTTDITSGTPDFYPISSNSSRPVYGVDVNANGEVLYVGDESRVYKGSQNMAYEIKNSYTPKLVDAHFTTTQIGYVVGEDYTVRKTTNGGQTWNAILPSTDFSGGVPELNAVYTHANGEAHLVGNLSTNPYIANINNNEATQLTSGIPTGTYPLHDVNFTDASNGIAVGGTTSAQIWLTDDAGATWTSATIPGGTNKLRAVHGFNRNNTYVAVGDDETMLYIDSSANVTSISSGVTSSENLYDVTFYDDVNGYAVGENGTLLKATNGAIVPTTGLLTGVTWALKSTTDDINANGKDIYAIDYANPYAVSLGGVHSTGDNYTRILRDESEQFSTYFWYDKLGRIVVSQNSKQYADSLKRYSYTLYDELGRVVEAGEKIENTNTDVPFKSIFGTYVSGLYSPKVIDDFKLNTWITDTTGKRQEVTRSFYDQTLTAIGIDTLAGFTQNQANLRKRISAITYEKEYDYGAGSQNTYNYASFYDYDIHGNVKTLIQDNKELTSNANPDIVALQYTRMDYVYDLISGNVHSVAYQKGKPDAWYHKYTYDGDNRIVTAETSTDNVIWDREAKYIYYDHGPLARVELGEHNVQGLDYAYTLQGWVKAVNSDLLNPNNDPGQDAVNNGTNPNGLFAKDVVGYSLHYRENDYSPIDYANKWQQESKRLASVFKPNGGGSDVNSQINNLYNGNIGAIVTTLTKPLEPASLGISKQEVMPQAMAYRYDQLNRIAHAKAYTNIDMNVANIDTANSINTYNTWGTSGAAYNNSYYNAFTYDASGNILTQVRHDQYGNKIEDLAYHYGDNAGKRLQNRLYSVSDFAGASEEALYDDDIEDMGFSYPTFENLNNGNENYAYDEIGQLKQNTQEDIHEIVWRVDNKIKAIIREVGSTDKNLIFDYDPMGNRIAKHVYGNDTVLFDPENATNWEYTTYYTRDAQGNVIATYDYKVDDSTATTSFNLIERNIYGSSRLGTNTLKQEMIGAYIDTTSLTHTLGAKRYELSNHLGNVLEVISDKKIYDTSITKPNYLTTFTDTVYTWEPSSSAHSAELNNGRLEVITGANLNGANGYYDLEAGKTYYISADVDRNNFTSDLEFGIFRGTSKDFGVYVDTTGLISTLFTPTVTQTYRLNFRMRETGYSGPLQTFYIDNVTIADMDSVTTGYFADIKSYNDYTPFGVTMKGRSANVKEYIAFDTVSDTTTNNYLSFNGSQNHVNCGTDDRDITNQVTLQAWVKTTNNSSIVEFIVSKYRTVGAIIDVVNGQAAVRGRSGNDGIFKSSGYSTKLINDGEWHLVTGVVTASDTWIVYVDGVLESSTDYNIPVVNMSNNTGLYIGRTEHQAYQYHYQGDLKEVSVWNRAKTDYEIQLDYQRGTLNGSEANLVGYFPLNEGIGTTVNDLSPNAINGTISGATWQTESIIDTVLTPTDSILANTTDFYRYGFNGMESDNEVSNKEGANYTAEFWQYNSLIGRRWEPDPVVNESESPYATFRNNPISLNDPNGDCPDCPNPTVNIGIGLNVGSHNNGISFNVSLSQKVGNWEASVGVGVTGYGTFANTGKGGLELRGSFQAGFNDGKTSLSLGTNVFKGVGGMSEFSQRTGILNIGIGDFKASYENDGYPFALGQKGLAAWAGDGDDKYRSAAVRLSYGKFSAGFNLFTGSRTNYDGDNDKIGKQQLGDFGEKMPNGYVIEDGPKYRMGAAYLGYGSTKLGIDSDRWIRHPIQDNWAHNMKIPDTRQPGFKSLSDNITPFFQTSTFSNQSSPTFTLYDF